MEAALGTRTGVVGSEFMFGMVYIGKKCGGFNAFAAKCGYPLREQDWQKCNCGAAGQERIRARQCEDALVWWCNQRSSIIDGWWWCWAGRRVDEFTTK